MCILLLHFELSFAKAPGRLMGSLTVLQAGSDPVLSLDRLILVVVTALTSAVITYLFTDFVQQRKKRRRTALDDAMRDVLDDPEARTWNAIFRNSAKLASVLAEPLLLEIAQKHRTALKNLLQDESEASQLAGQGQGLTPEDLRQILGSISKGIADLETSLKQPGEAPPTQPARPSVGKDLDRRSAETS
jgi:hypothetical protein